tara:strand:+ start:28 stop:474 length:447 start_codon:yes stop_codon:yes gene_type:complete
MNNEKIGKITEQQRHFIYMFVNDFDLNQILEDLEINSNIVTNWMTNNPVFLSYLNSAIYLKELSLYTHKVNLKLKALKKLDNLLDTKNIDAITLILKDKVMSPGFDSRFFSSESLKKSNISKFFKSLEEDLNLPPHKYRGGTDDDAPF